MKTTLPRLVASPGGRVVTGLLALGVGLPGLSPPRAPAQVPVFEDVTARAGITHLQHRTGSPALGFPQAHMSGGVAAVDFDDDGWVDLYFTRLDRSNLLYRNLGNGTFADVTEAAFGPNHLAGVRSNGCAWADIDNDGDQDLYVTTLNSHRYYLFVNDGRGSFTEEAVLRGAAVEGPDLHFGMSASFGDYDNDGYLDLHVTEWRTSSQNLLRRPANTRLFRNRGAGAPGHFVDVTIPARVEMNERWVGSHGGESFAFCSRFADLDQDGWPELIVASDGGTSRLFWNNRDGTFTDGTAAAQVGTDQFGMGMALGDYDRDGDLDWFVTSIYGSALRGNGNRLYRYDGSRTFSDVTDAADVRNGGWGWGASFLDYDNDRTLDLMMVNGYQTTAPEAAILWKNEGAARFSKMSEAICGLTDQAHATGLVCFDYNNDGCLDALVVRNGATPILYRNQGGTPHQWIRIKLQGTRSNRDGIGALLRVRPAPHDPPLLGFVDGGNNFLGQNDRTVHFGLGASGRPSIASIEITWPSGRRQILADLAPNQVLTVVEPDPAPVPLIGIEALAPDRLLAMTWDSEPETVCVVERSVDLRSWRKAAVLRAEGEQVRWLDQSDQGGSSAPRQYYRAWR